MLKIGVLVSGGGTNLQAIIDACSTKTLDGQVVAVLANKPGVFALERAQKASIFNVGLSRKSFDSSEDFYGEIRRLLKAQGVELIVLAGYLGIVPQSFVEAFHNKIINIHPSLIPSYAGKGYYGMKVHQGVIENKEAYTGATVHFVDGQVDTGQIILQESIKVLKDDTAETLQQRVLTIEHQVLIKSIDKFIKGEI